MIAAFADPSNRTGQGSERIGSLTVFRAATGPGGRLPIAEREARLVAVLLADGPCRVRQQGLAVELARGEWTIYAPEALARLDGAVSARVVFAPRASLGEADAYLPGARLNRFTCDEAINRVTFSMLQAACDQAPGVTFGSGHAVALAAIHLLKTALIERAGRRHARNALLERVKEILEWRLRDPELSVVALGRALGCTERSIQRAFRSQAETFGRYLLRRRLERCREELAASRPAQPSVSEVAFSYGFNSLAHFSRAYKEHFGHSPSAARAIAPSSPAAA